MKIEDFVQLHQPLRDRHSWSVRCERKVLYVGTEKKARQRMEIIIEAIREWEAFTGGYGK